MPDNIAGYADKTYIKGQYYRYAASPKPVVFNGNIDDIVGTDLLVKAMFVTRGEANGTFPSDFGDTFLVQTIKYGTDTYLQTAYLVQSGYDCYEYRRIYSNGNWTAWIGIDSQIAEVDTKAQDAKDTADDCAGSISTMSGQISSLNSSVNSLNSSIGSVSGQIGSVSNRLSTVESRTVNCGKKPLNLWSGTLYSGSITLPSCYNRHPAFLVVAKVQDKSNASFVTQYITQSQLTTSDASYCVSDEFYWLSYYVRYSNNDLIITIRSKHESSNGFIKDVWGIY